MSAIRFENRLTLNPQTYAQWPEAKIESYLGIKNQAVAEEIDS